MISKKNKIAIMSVTALLAGAGIVGITMSLIGQPTSQFGAEEAPTFSMTLDNGAKLAGNTTAVVKTALGNPITMNATSLVYEFNTDFGSLNKGGSFENATPMTGLKSIGFNVNDFQAPNGTLTIEFGVLNNGVVDYDLVEPATLNGDGEVLVADHTTYDVSYLKVSNSSDTRVAIGQATYNFYCTGKTTDYKKVSFYKEGLLIDTTYVASGSTFAPIADPTMDGYTFNGWVDDEGSVVKDRPITANLNVNATWLHNVRWSIAGSVQKDIYTFEKAYEVISPALSTGATLDDYSKDGFLVGAKTANTTYSVTMPKINYASYIGTGGEVSFTLHTVQEWEYFNVAGGDIYYESGHGASDPYKVSIRNNGNGFGVYATSTKWTNFGEIATLSDEVASGTAGLVISFHSEQADRQVYISKLSIHTYDYKQAAANALTALKDDPTFLNLVYYSNALTPHMTAYDKTVYTEPTEVTNARIAHTGETNSFLGFPTQSDYFSSTAEMIKDAGTKQLFTDCLNAIGVTYDPYAWEFQVEAGKTSAFLELPAYAYSDYATTLFKMWRGGENAALYVNGTKLADSTDCPNADWAYWLEITPSGDDHVLKLYHGAGSRTKGDYLNISWTLPAAVAHGQTPLRLEIKPTSAFTATATWGLSSVVGTL